MKTLELEMEGVHGDNCLYDVDTLVYTYTDSHKAVDLALMAIRLWYVCEIPQK